MFPLALRAVPIIEYLIPPLIVCAGAALQGAFGFGLGLFAAPLLALVDPAYVPGPLITTGLILTLFLAIRERQAMDVRRVGTAIVGRVPGVLLGSVALTVFSSQAIGIGFGVLILAAVMMSVGGMRFRPTAAALLGAGCVSGFMGTTTGVGGPPLALVLQHQTGPQFRSTMFGYFTVGISISLASLTAFGLYGTRELVMALRLVPGAFVGYFLSGMLIRSMHARTVRPAVLALSATAAVVIILRQLV